MEFSQQSDMGGMEGVFGFVPGKVAPPPLAGNWPETSSYLLVQSVAADGID
jgi:hypothetical protein